MSKDVTENRLEEYDDVFADIIDNLVLGGAGIVREDELVSRQTKSYTRRQDGTLRGGMRDIRKECHRAGLLRLICGIENQTQIDNTMPERIMGYEYADYEAQVKTFMNENNAKKRRAGARRIFKKQKLAPVLTSVLYYGEKEWKHPVRLHDMIQFPEGMEEILKTYVADYPMNLIQVARLTDEERARLTSDFRIVAEYLACKNDKSKWKEFLKNTKKILHIEELLDVIWELSGDDRYEMLCDQIREKKVRKEKWDVCEIAEELEKIGMEKGIIAMIQDNLSMGNEKKTILEKIVHYFSVSQEQAVGYYERAIAQ